MRVSAIGLGSSFARVGGALSPYLALSVRVTTTESRTTGGFDVGVSSHILIVVFSILENLGKLFLKLFSL